MPPSDDRSRRIGRERQRAGRMSAGLAAALCLLLGAAVVASGQGAPPAAAKTATPPVALSFTEFHGYAAATDYLKKVAAAYPGITDLVEIGRSQSGRPIYVLVVSTRKTGVTIDGLVSLANPRKPAVSNVTPMKPYQGKPAQWIDGGTHGATLAGTEVCLYIIEKLVSGYGSDAEITRLVDDSAFYICPMVYQDGGVEAGKPAPRAETASTVNGNYPEGWWKDDNTPGGTGDFPSSSPEARAVLEFFTNHTNILLAQSFHTSGGYTLRPFARWPDSRIDPRDAAVFDRVLGRKYLELIGEPVPASWIEALPQGGAQVAPRTPGQPAGQGGRRGGVSGAAPAADQPSRRGTAAIDQPRAWRSAYNQERQEPGGYGAFADWAYGQFGAYTMSTQLWDSKRDTKAVPGDGLAALCETHWQFERFKATLLPHVEIAEVAAKLLYTTSQASKATATQSGDAVLIRKGGTPGRYKVVQITATIANTGSLPTQVAHGAQLRGNREDVIWLLGDPAKITFLEGTRWMRLGVLQGTLPLPAAAGPAAGVAGARGGGGGGRGGFGAQANQSPLAQMRQQRPDAAEPRQTGNRRVVSWLVAVEGDTPLRLAVTSQKGGTRVKDLVIQ